METEISNRLAAADIIDGGSPRREMPVRHRVQQFFLPPIENPRQSFTSREDPPTEALVSSEAVQASSKSDVQGDRSNIAILFLLYVLQGIPLGLIAAMPMLLQNRGASYTQQAEFSLANWPFTLKLLWAPIVDALYVRRFGRRKSWLVPVQYLIGVFMLFFSWHVEQWMGGDSVAPRVTLLAVMFFVLNFLAATQDIAVDGWALTMLKRCNIGYASTCNSVGQSVGYSLGYVLPVALESKEFCNAYLRDVPKDECLVSLSQFLSFWGVCFLVITTLVALFKREQCSSDDSSDCRNVCHQDLTIGETYKILLGLMRMRPVQILAGVLLTVKVAFAACDAVTSLKLLDAGLSNDKLALLAVPIIPLQIVLPIMLTRYTHGPRPLFVYLQAIPYRLLFATSAAIITYLTPYVIVNGKAPAFYYVLLVVIYAAYHVFSNCMFVAVMGFFASISDPAVGGTYMTFLNTLTNLGGIWPNTVVLWLVDVLTWVDCPSVEASHHVGEEEKQIGCYTVLDGYYVESIICALYGVIWLVCMRKWIKYLQELPRSSWFVMKKEVEVDEMKVK